MLPWAFAEPPCCVHCIGLALSLSSASLCLCTARHSCGPCRLWLLLPTLTRDSLPTHHLLLQVWPHQVAACALPACRLLQNILLARDGRAKLADVGLAQLMDAQQQEEEGKGPTGVQTEGQSTFQGTLAWAGEGCHPPCFGRAPDYNAAAPQGRGFCCDAPQLLAQLHMLCPLGLHRLLTCYCGCLHAVGPEVLTGGQVTEKADIYSLGVVLWEVVTLEVPKRGCMRDPQVPLECPQKVADAIGACMQVSRGGSALERLRAKACCAAMCCAVLYGAVLCYVSSWTDVRGCCGLAAGLPHDRSRLGPRIP